MAAVLAIWNAHTSAQDFPAIIGRIEGDDLEVVTKTPTGTETDAGPTVVASGSDVTLHSGHALLLLNAGGEISICGPAHFRMVKSSGALTVALDYGRVHPSLEVGDAFIIYTPTIVATPIAISGGPRDMTVGLDENGEMCVLTERGAMRLEPQFSDQSMIIPQGGTATLVEGQIMSLQTKASACSCEYPRARMQSPKATPPVRSQPDREVSTLAAPQPPEPKKNENAPPPASPNSEPIYTVLMPPLSFDAKSPEPSSAPPPAPEIILLVREVRLRPPAEFRGHVNPAPAKVVESSAPVATPPPTPASQPSKPQPGFLDRVRSFFHSLSSLNSTV
ncbi:MAG TPA: hypothetical protein VGI34_01215 [Candidatus Acidoferrales bacterium]